MLAFSCREVLPLESEPTIQGYQLNGSVTTPNGISLDSVGVQLYYNYSFVSDTPVDTVPVIVVNPSRILDIAVYTPSFQLVRQLFLGYRPAGVVPRALWGGIDQHGVPVPDGKYLIRYVVDTTIVKYSPVLIDGQRTVVTDNAGRFSLTSDRLPVGEYFDIYDDFNRYQGTYAVTSTIDLRLQKSTLSTDYLNIVLQKGKIITKAFIL
jgi:hypothetical protein